MQLRSQYRIKELRLSHSSRQLFRTCERKFEFRKMIESNMRDDSQAASAGKALHAAYQDYLVNKNKNSAVFTLMREYPTVFDNNPMNDRSLEACYGTLHALFVYADSNRYEIVEVEFEGKLRPCIEVPFQFNVLNYSISDEVNIPAVYIGYMDIILYDRLTDQYIVVDLKTHRRTTEDMTSIYQFDDQCIPYAIALERALGKPINQLSVQYLSAYIDIISPTIKPYTFEKTQADIQDWAQGFASDLMLMKQFYSLEWFPRKGRSCFDFQKTCGYFDYCQSRDLSIITSLMASNEEPAEVKEYKPWFTVELDLGF